MKVSASVKLRCANCQFVRRGTKTKAGQLYVICRGKDGKGNKKHKQRQG